MDRVENGHREIILDKLFPDTERYPLLISNQSEYVTGLPEECRRDPGDYSILYLENTRNLLGIHPPNDWFEYQHFNEFSVYGQEIGEFLRRLIYEGPEYLLSMNVLYLPNVYKDAQFDEFYPLITECASKELVYTSLNYHIDLVNSYRDYDDFEGYLFELTPTRTLEYMYSFLQILSFVRNGHIEYDANALTDLMHERDISQYMECLRNKSHIGIISIDRELFLDEIDQLTNMIKDELSVAPLPDKSPEYIVRELNSKLVKLRGALF